MHNVSLKYSIQVHYDCHPIEKDNFMISILNQYNMGVISNIVPKKVIDQFMSKRGPRDFTDFLYNSIIFRKHVIRMEFVDTVEENDIILDIENGICELPEVAIDRLYFIWKLISRIKQYE